MGSRTHTTGAGQLAAAALGSGLAGVLARNDQLSADNRFAVYVAPAGNGLHLVKNLCNDQAYQVGAAVGMTFTKGQSVVLASANGQPGEVIIGLAPPGAQGASELPTAITVRPLGLKTQPRPAACPTPITGKKYLGIFGGDGNFTPYAYLDGTIGAAIASPVEAFCDDPGALRLVLSSLPQRLLVAAGGTAISTWRVDDAIVVRADVDAPSAVVLVGDRVYFYRSWVDGSLVRLQLYSIPPGQASPVDLGAAAVGGEASFSGLSGAINGPLGYFGSSKFVILSVGGSYYYQGGGWSFAASPPSASLSTLPGPVVQVFSAVTWPRGARACFGLTLTGSPASVKQVDMVPVGAWNISQIGALSTSPDGEQIACYPFLTGLEEEGINRYLFRCRPQLATFGGACAVPRILVDRGGPGSTSPLAMIALN